MPVSSRVYATPLATPFLPALVDGVLDGVFWPDLDAADPLALARITLYVPGRRLARETLAALQRGVAARGRAATLLPRVIALGDLDAAADPALDPDADVPVLSEGADAVGGLVRHLAVMKLVDDWPRADTPERRDKASILIPCSPADTAHLAADLIRLMDEMGREEAEWSGLDTLVEDRLTEYWGVSRDFLRIAHRDWPKRLAQANAHDEAAERLNAYRAEAERIAKGRGPVLAVASPSYTKAQGNLIAAIAGRPDGAVLLPGLDAAVEEACWEAVNGRGARQEPGPDEGHGQCGLAHLLERLRVKHRDVKWLAEPAARDRLLAEALRPAETCDRWATMHERLTDTTRTNALERVTLIEAATPREEALAIALDLRRALEEGHERIALITPDRTLARRVTGELKRWDIEADDSGGRPLGTTPPAVLARLALACVQGGVTPIDLLALLKHPLARPASATAEAGEGSDTFRRDLRRLDKALRGLKPRSGFDGLRAHLDAAQSQRGASDESAARHASTLDLLAQAEAALAPLLALHADGTERPVHEIAAAHCEACLALAGPRLFAQEDGEALARLMDALAAPDRSGTDFCPAPGEWPGLFTALLSTQAVRNRRPAHARIQVLGLLEARQLAFDHAVLAGLNEGAWPDAMRNDAWLSRPMRRALGLPPPERRLGEAAHDFASGFATPSLVLSRALRSGGAPTLPARWLQRLSAVAGAAWDDARTRGDALIAHARALDVAPPPKPLTRPEPTPPVDARPKRLSVTEVETLIRDPYAIYARHVLRLTPLDELGEEPGPREFGTAVHAGMEGLAADDLTQGAERRFAQTVWGALEDAVAGTETAPVWRRHIDRLAGFAVDWERARRETGATAFAEQKGAWTFDVGGEPFTLSGRADRLEIDEEGRVSVIDHKTGQVPTKPQVLQGFQPQLGLLAAMAHAGAFDDGLPDGIALAGMSAGDLGYTRLQGRGDDGEAIFTQGTKPLDAAAHAEEVSQGLQALLMAYRDPAQAYPSAPRVQFRDGVSVYGHLARIREWSLVGGEE